jgi:hypothetical protein
VRVLATARARDDAFNYGTVKRSFALKVTRRR